MWAIILLFGVFLGYLLQERKASLDKWAIAAIVTLVIGFIFSFIMPALIPDIKTLMLPATAQVPAYITLTIVSLILGLILSKIREALEK